MTDQNNSDGAAPAARIIKAERYRGKALIGFVDIHAYTKHGSTCMISVMPPQNLQTGEVLKTRVWILGAKEFVVMIEHQKPMKLPGTWYEVKTVQQGS